MTTIHLLVMHAHHQTQTLSPKPTHFHTLTLTQCSQPQHTNTRFTLQFCIYSHSLATSHTTKEKKRKWSTKLPNHILLKKSQTNSQLNNPPFYIKKKKKVSSRIILDLRINCWRGEDFGNLKRQRKGYVNNKKELKVRRVEYSKQNLLNPKI